MPQEALSTTAEEILAANPYRRSAIFHNPDATIVMWIDSGPATGMTTSNMSIRIPAGGTRTISWLDDGADEVVKEWAAVAESGTPSIAYKEFSGRGLTTNELLAALLKSLEAIAVRV